MYNVHTIYISECYHKYDSDKARLCLPRIIERKCFIYSIAV